MDKITEYDKIRKECFDHLDKMINDSLKKTKDSKKRYIATSKKTYSEIVKIAKKNKKFWGKYMGWIDGKCKLCGAKVYEEPGDKKDYKNRCLNKKCINHVWHEVYDDDDTLDYYKHV